LMTMAMAMTMAMTMAMSGQFDSLRSEAMRGHASKLPLALASHAMADVVGWLHL
jgi:hypothetical protein